MNSPSRRIDFTGIKSGHVTVIGDAPTNPTNGHRFVRCECVCGKVWDVDLQSIRRKTTKSCGCQKAEMLRSRFELDEEFRYPEITQEVIQELLEYNEVTGDFVWKHRSRKYFGNSRLQTLWNARYAGQPAGCIDTKGYLTIGIFNKVIRAQRLAILITDGYFPVAVDHINMDRLDNRRCNIRVASRSQNQFNQKIPCTNTSGIKGVWFDKRRNKWVSQIRANGLRHWVGEFETLEAAAAAVKTARNKLHGEFANHG